MAPTKADSPQKGQLLEADNDDMMPATTPGCSAMALHMRNFAATSMEQDYETDWDSESDQCTQKFQTSGYEHPR